MNEIPFIGCINLKSRTDRFRNMKLEFTKINLLPYVHFIRPCKHELGGKIGCFDSHLQLYRHCIENNYEYALILEDDIQFLNRNIPSAMRNVKYIQKHYPSWCKINCHNWGFVRFKECVTPTIMKGGSFGAPCYFISKRGMEIALQTHITHNHLDLQQLYDFDLDDVFYLSDNLAKIIPSESDNDEYGEMITHYLGRRALSYTTYMSTLPHRYNLLFKNNEFSKAHLMDEFAVYKKNNIQMDIALNKDEIKIYH